jgi:hypothetical protein
MPTSRALRMAWPRPSCSSLGQTYPMPACAALVAAAGAPAEFEAAYWKRQRTAGGPSTDVDGVPSIIL